MKRKIQQHKGKQSQTNELNTAAVEPKSFSDHIGELRRRTFFVALVFMVASALAYNYRNALVDIIMSPLGDEKLVYLTPGGGFNFVFQVSLYAGLIAAAPMLIYQLYGFIRPALPARAQRSSLKIVAVAFLLMACGVAFGYFVAIPSALNFLSTFAGASVTPTLTADSYLGFFLAYIAGLGVLFELPLLLLFFHWIHPMTPGKLLKSERFVILFAFVASAMITPTPDVLNQSMIAVPLIAIYQLGVIVVLINIRKAHKREPASRKEQMPVEMARPIPITPGAVPQVSALPVQPVSMQQQPVQKRQVKAVDGFAKVRPASVRAIVPERKQQPLPMQPRSARAMPYRRLSIDGFMS